MEGGSARGASTVVGVLLLVGVVVIVGGVVALGALTFLDGTGAPQATATFDYEETPVGVRMTPDAISTTVTVQLNGRDVATFDPESAGQSVLLPTAPGDRITVVSRDGEQSVLVDRTVDDRSEVGDFIAYYTFDGEDGDTTLEDQSGTDNEGDLRGDGDSDGPEWTGNSLRFDGSGDYVDVENVDPPEGVEVESFTVAVAYTQEGDPGGVDQLVEHNFDSDSRNNLEWFLETTGGDPHSMDYTVDYNGGSPVISSNADYASDERHVAVGTYDGSEYTLYMNGERIDTENHDQEINIENMHIGRDYESDIQYFDGEIHEIRLYYSAFDDEEVDVITNAME